MTRLTFETVRELAKQEYLTLVLANKNGGNNAKYVLYRGKGRHKEILIGANTLPTIKQEIDLRKKINELQRITALEARKLPSELEKLNCIHP